MSGVERIAAERQRQIEELGYDSDHDAQHEDSDLAFAAVCYAAPIPVYLIQVGTGTIRWVEPWPPGWTREPRALEDDTMDVLERIRELEKAGALIAAEIDRLEEL